MGVSISLLDMDDSMRAPEVMVWMSMVVVMVVSTGVESNASLVEVNKALSL